MKRLEFNKENADKYGVETRDGRAVRIFCWDLISKKGSILAGIYGEKEENPYLYHSNGRLLDYEKSGLDLLIKIPPRWRAVKGEYYYIANYRYAKFIVQLVLDRRDDLDENWYNKDNYFKTEEEAQKFANYLNDCAKYYTRKDKANISKPNPDGIYLVKKTGKAILFTR